MPPEEIALALGDYGVQVELVGAATLRDLAETLAEELRTAA